MVRAVTDDDTGVRILHEPTPPVSNVSNQIIDIIAVHSIGVHPDDTWCKNVGTKDDPSWVNWLSDPTMLPSVIPHARIMRYGYKSQWFGAYAIKQNTSRVAQRFLLALSRRRKEFPHRPLIIVAHCFGGLVVLKALLQAYHDSARWHGIFQSTTGLVFFGTPFRGAEGISQSEMLQAALSEYDQEEVYNEVLTILQPGNELLQDMMDEFGKIRTLPNRAQVACFFELQPGNVGTIVGKQRKTRFVVSESSGCLDLSAATEKYSLERSHFNMNKFGKPSEEDFLTVSEVLEKMAKSGPDLVLARLLYRGKHHVSFSLRGLPAVWNFVTRKTEMRALTDYFLPGKQDALHGLSKQKTFLLHGLGGMGKTQLAAAFALEHRDRFSAVLWLDGSSVDRLKQSFVAVATELPNYQLATDAPRSHPDDKIDVDVVVEDVLHWLSLPSNKHWLLIIDNVDRNWTAAVEDTLAYILMAYLPQADHGSVLITSRLMGMLCMFGGSLHVDRVDNVQARSILESNAGRTLEDAQAILDRLDRLPLALTQAGLYLRETNISVSSYIKHYDNMWRDLMEEQGHYAFCKYGERSSILTTWMTSYKQVAAESEEAAGLLRLWGFLNHKDLWYGLLAPTRDTDDDASLPPWLSAVLKNELRFNRVIRLLRRYSLVDAAVQQTDSHAIHPVLHTWCRHLTVGHEKSRMLLLALRVIVAQAVPSRLKQMNWRTQRRLLLHAMQVYAQIGLLERLDDHEYDSAAWQLHVLANLFKTQSKLVEAQHTLERAVSSRDKTLGSMHYSTLNTVHNLDSLYRDLGKPVEAEHMFERALTGREATFGPMDPSTLVTMNNLDIL